MIAENLKDVVKRRGLTYKGAAKKCGLSFASFYSYVSGTRSPGLDAVRKIATGLNIPVEDFFKEPEPSYPHVEMIMRDPAAKCAFEKMLVKWNQLSPEAKKSVDDYIAFVLEQDKKK